MSLKIKENDFIPTNLFGKIVQRLPIASVEALIVVDNTLLLLKRNNTPVKDQWWFPGGRIHKGESLESALRREVKEETDLEITDCRFINVYSRVLPERHDITIAYVCKCEKGKVVLNNEHSEYKFFKEMPANLHPCLQETIRDFIRWKKSSD